MYRRLFERERRARKEAEQHLEIKSRALHLSNQKLADLTNDLHVEVKRTKAELARQKALENQLILAQKMESVGQSAAGVAHELNTPIQFVNDNLNFLKTSFEDIEQLLAAVDSLVLRCRNQGMLPKQIAAIDTVAEAIDLDFVRTEAPLAASQAIEGSQTLARIVKAMNVFSHPGTESFEPVCVNQLLRSTLTVSRAKWKYHAELETEFSDSLPPVSCLPGELGQAFLNLIVNAASAIGTRGPTNAGVLTVGTSLQGDTVLIQISDTGCGIPPEIQHRVFDPFFTTKGVGEGTGQGLSISYRIIVELHRGALTFESDVDRGTTFWIRLPVEQKPELEKSTV